MKLKRDWNALFYGKLRKYKLLYYCYISTAIAMLSLLLRKIKFGNKVRFYGKTYFYRAENSTISIGNQVTFRSDKTSNQIGLMRRCIITTLAENANISIGDKSGFSGVSIGAAKKICIGANVLVGANCLITDTNWHNLASGNRHLCDPFPGEIIIGNNVFIGYGSIILKNVNIGDNSVIGAGSVVTKSIPANVIAAGNPCRIIRLINC